MKISSIIWGVSDAQGRILEVQSRNEALSLSARLEAEGFGEHFPRRVLRFDSGCVSVEFIPFARTDRRRRLHAARRGLRSKEVGHA